MIEEWFWDRNVTEGKLKKILLSPREPKFAEIVGLILARENMPKRVFKYIEPRIFCENWPRIKKQMRKNKWNESRIIFWQAIYEKVLEKFKRKGIKIKKFKENAKDTILASVGAQIKDFRLKKKMSQEQLASKIGVSQQMLSYIEQGKENVSLLTLKRIVDKLNGKLSINIFGNESKK